MNHLSLFSGIGGLDLAAHWAGMTTVAFCERDAFCQKVLSKHWPNVPIWDDIHGLTRQSLSDGGIGRIDIVSGGFPCQPHSVAGKRKGQDDIRYLWPQMLRVIKETEARWCIIENVAGILSDGTADNVCAELEDSGYTCWPVDTTACAFGLPTLERHIWIIAESNSQRPQRRIGSEVQNIPAVPRQFQRSDTGECNRWAVSKARVCGVDERIPNRVDRNRALGNSVPPQQAYPIFASIMRLEESS